ncbi:MAG TPA: hypothetical protein DET40_22750 [Lentisphaeria bacterium]|nr:MAG: hypothetical protein A2X45_16040 [Lentisphaerae bacterium GWF2_50_93]HCE46374.1 hypothetical protein [Lentisphaeria bacterium]
MQERIKGILFLFLFVSGFSAICGDEAKPADKSSVIILKNNDMLHGGLLSVSPVDGKVLWQHPDSKTPFSFLLKNLRQIDSSGIDPKISKDSPPFALVLTNGDVLSGSIISMDTAYVMLKTWFAGDLKIDRRMLKEIINTGSSQPVFKGPNSLNEWHVQKMDPENAMESDMPGKVEFKDGCLAMSGYEAYADKKDIKIPEMVKMEYTTTLNNDGSGVIFFTDAPITNKDGNSLDSEIYRMKAYGVSISRHSISAGRCRNGEWQSGGDSAEARIRNLLASSPKIKVDIYASRKAGTINVFLNNSPALKYIDQDSDFPKGGGLCFVMVDNSENAPIQISNIKIGAWDGKLPSTGSSDEQLDKDTILFSNKDKTTGRLRSINNGSIQFDTEFAQLAVPLERISSILTSGEKRRQARREINDVKAYFDGDDCITVNISDISGGKIKGRSENFGEVTLDMDAFSKISFNIYDED